MTPEDILDAYHASMGDAFNGLPKMPKEIAELRVGQLQEELAATEDADRISVLNREIAETQEILATQNYSETPEEIEYWNTYGTGLREFIENR